MSTSYLKNAPLVQMCSEGVHATMLLPRHSQPGSLGTEACLSLKGLLGNVFQSPFWLFHSVDLYEATKLRRAH